jgi:hypothetical protein
MRGSFFAPVQGMQSNGSQVFAFANLLSSSFQVLDSSVDPQLTVSSISPASGAQGATVTATITGTNLTGATFVGFTGTGVTAAILPGGTSTSVPVSITIAPNAALGIRSLWVDTPTGTSNLFGSTLAPGSGFTVTTP